MLERGIGYTGGDTGVHSRTGTLGHSASTLSASPPQTRAMSRPPAAPQGAVRAPEPSRTALVTAADNALPGGTTTDPQAHTTFSAPSQPPRDFRR